MRDPNRVEIDNGTVFVEDHDFVEPWKEHGVVLLQHGFSRNGRFWSPWVPHLGRHYRIVRPDLRGCGFSSDPGTSYVYNFDDLVADLIKILDTLELDSVHFVGEALACVIGVQAAVAHPNRFKSLSLLHTPTKVSKESREMQAAGHPSWPDAIRTLGMEKWWHTARVVTGDLTGNPKADQHAAREGGRTPVHVAIGLTQLARSFDITPILPQVRTPTQFHNSGRYSYVTTPEQQRNLLELLPQAGLIIHEKATGRSFFPFDDVDLVAPYVLKFIQDIDSSVKDS